MIERVRRVLGTSRYLVILAVLGTFITAAVLMVFGLVRSIGMIGSLLTERSSEHDTSNVLIIDAVSIIDIFLLATVLYIISAGLFQLFVEPDLPLPEWLVIDSIGDLKIRLAGVIVVGMLVAFLGYLVDWQGGTDIVAPAVGIAAIVIAVAVYFHLTPPETRERPTDRDPTER